MNEQIEQYLPFSKKYTAHALRNLYAALADAGACGVRLTSLQYGEEHHKLIGWSRSRSGSYKYLYVYRQP